MLVQYVGVKPLPYRVPTPIPYLSRTADGQGELTFNPSCDVPNDEWATFLVTQCGGSFVPVEVLPASPPKPSKAERSIGRRFQGPAGKWRAYAFLKKHGFGDMLGMTKLQIGDKVMHWELVPIATASVTLKDFPTGMGKRRSVPTPAEERSTASISSNEEGQKE